MSPPHPPEPVVDGALGDAPSAASLSEAAMRLRVERSAHVPAFSQATWGLAVHALAESLRQNGLDDDDDGWHADGGGAPESARVTVRPERDGVRVSLTLERTTPGSLIWAIPILFWPFAFLLVVLVGRGELPWHFWVIPALFGLAPSALLAVRWSAHRAWEALAVRRALRALDAVAEAVQTGNRLEALPGQLFVPAPVDVFEHEFDEPVLRALSGDDDPDWSDPFVAPTDEPAGLEMWISMDEAEAIGERLRTGELSIRTPTRLTPPDAAPSGDGHAGDGHIGVVPRPAPRPWRERRRRAADGWVRRTLSNGFGEWLPDRDAAAP